LLGESVEGGDAVGSDAADDDATVGGVFDEALGFEAPERFTDRGLGDTPSFGDDFLAEAFTGLQAAGEDGAVERFVDQLNLGLRGAPFDRHGCRIAHPGEGEGMRDEG